MHQRLIRAGDMKVMPWKNGGGTTTEIAAHPPGAGLDEFTWRVSIADVAASGPFSKFPGIDRIITVIDGPDMTLRGPDGEITLRSFAPHRFAGETAIDGVLGGGPVRDFNVMTRRGRARATLAVVRGPLDPARAGTTLIYCARGAASPLAAGDALLLDGPGPIAIAPGPGAVLLRVEITATG